MKKEVSIVKVDRRSYRKIAQDNWGLTNEQMVGKHVHHRIHRRNGGGNDPSNLYVCSPWFHDNVWHKGDGGFIQLATEAGQRGGKKGGITTGNRHKREKTGICSPGYIASDEKKATCRDNGKKNGARNVELGLGFCSPAYRQSPACLKDKGRAGEKGGLKTFQESK